MSYILLFGIRFLFFTGAIITQREVSHFVPFLKCSFTRLHVRRFESFFPHVEICLKYNI